MKKFIPIILFVLPLFVSADLPAFPMAFYGTATLNGMNAPEGTVIKAYYGNTLAGEVSVDANGSYGYLASTAQKLLVGEGNGVIIFKFQSSSILNGAESSGNQSVTYSAFESGAIKNLNMAFAYELPVASSVSSGGRSRGGGGGGATITSQIPIGPAVLGVATSREAQILLIKAQIQVLLAQLVQLLQAQLAVVLLTL